jgi:hypothetical protein
MKVCNGFEIANKKLSVLKPILIQWTHNINDYCKQYYNKLKPQEKDAPYWYNERATLSTFAGAVWKLGGIALEEYRAKKKVKREKWEGRVDLWFQFKRKMYVIEAKQHWCLIDKQRFNKGLVKDRIQHRLKSAISNVIEAPAEEGYPIGIVFVVPKIRERSLSLLRKFFDSLRAVKPDFIAWSFPECAETLIWEKFYYPGVALIGKSAGQNGVTYEKIASPIRNSLYKKIKEE